MSKGVCLTFLSLALGVLHTDVYMYSLASSVQVSDPKTTVVGRLGVRLPLDTLFHISSRWTTMFSMAACSTLQKAAQQKLPLYTRESLLLILNLDVNLAGVV